MNMPQRRVAPPPSHQVLDPRSLGRPVHMLGTFTARLKADLMEIVATGLNRRYGASFQVGEVTMARLASPAFDEEGPRWQTWAAEVGRIGFQLDRAVLLSVLHYRYGQQGGAPARGVADTVLPESATEARLASMLGLQLLKAVAQRIDTVGAGCASAEDVVHEFVPVPGPALAGPSDQWTIAAVVRERAHGIEGSLRFRLDEAWMARLLRHLAPTRDQRDQDGQAGPSPVARLPLTVVARLLEKDMPLGELLDIRVGDVIPVHLGLADVLVDQACLFQAVVAEHKGKLCLTAFEDTDE